MSEYLRNPDVAAARIAAYPRRRTRSQEVGLASASHPLLFPPPLDGTTGARHVEPTYEDFLVDAPAESATSA
ncbi:hypothetical protein [Frondihabitans cladoniiphilus]|uniref:Uncharacterized protein n=1 Tax=Frondihabitans cladoniiphilus TaxID=715785 RepID=A0ABP8W5F6_9MICO